MYLIRHTATIRLRHIRNLIFFVVTLTACTTREPEHAEIVWTDEEAVAIAIPQSLAGTHTKLSDAFYVRIKGNDMKMLGGLEKDGHQLIFRPLVPLTRGLSYQVVASGRIIADVSVPAKSENEQAVLEIFPSQDTVPENLLKVYFRFSRPMQQGYALHYLTLLDESGDTLQGTFLDLKPELWNNDHTMLTVWLDPGRIKRGLHPNEQLGQPLMRGNRYTLTVSSDWKDVQGVSLGRNVVKEFMVARRDSLSPIPSRWSIDVPGPNTTDNLCVRFHEPMDYGLLRATLHVRSMKDNSLSSPGGDKLIPGSWLTSDEESVVCFKPESAWKSGVYMLEIETRLEDLAGNNITRPFERDIAPDNDMPERSPTVGTEDVQPNATIVSRTFVVGAKPDL